MNTKYSGIRRDRREMAASVNNWVTVDDGNLDPDSAQIFLKRKNAVQLYAGGASLRQITDETGIVSKELYRFLDRCEAVGEDGRLNGWRGIVPNSHVMPRQRNDQLDVRIGHSNKFALFISKHPTIRDNLESLALNGYRSGEKGIKRELKIKKIHSEFLIDCRMAGVTVKDYPLSSENAGYSAIRRFVKAVRGQHGGGIYPAGGISELLPVTRCYQRVEADGHWKDVICTVEFPSPTSRGVIYLPIQRLWIIPIVETISTAVLSYSISYGGNYSADNLIQSVRKSILPWEQLPGLVYPNGGGFPTAHSEFQYICYDEILLDNHKGHLSPETASQLHRVLGVTPVYGSIDNQNMRAHIEGFFVAFEEVIHQLVSSTGSNPNDKPVKNPSANAIRYAITDQKIHELAERFLARYNSERPPGSSLSRIEILQRYVADPRALVRRVPVVKRNNIELYDLVLDFEIHGDQKQGIRPYVYWLESRYTNEVIASNYAFIGTTLRAYGNSGDCRRLKAYFPSGSDAGEIICERRFRNTPHSVQTRKYANASRRSGNHKISIDGDDIAGYIKSIEEKAPTSKKAATEIARLKAEARSLGAKHMDDAQAHKNDDKKNIQGPCVPSSPWSEKIRSIRTRF